MMVIDSVHSSAVGRMHAGQIRQMKIVRPLHIFEAHAAKSSPSLGGLEEKKSSGTSTALNLESRPSLVIRRRIMVPHLDAATVSPALSNSSITTSTNSDLQDKKPTDRTRSHLDVILSRSSTPDQTCKLSAATAPQPPKTIHLFDLNELPGSPDCPSAAESPTSTIASADSTAHNGAAIAVPAAPEVKLFSGFEGDGAKLAVDLGLLPKTRPVEGNLSIQAPADPPTPPRKRLRKLSEYQPTHDSLIADTDHGGDVCVRRTPKPEMKKAVVLDDEVLGAASVLMTLSSSSSKKRSLDSIAEGGSSGFFWDEDGAGPSGAAGSETTSSRSLGSGGSVLLRPSNKQRYRSMEELMAQPPGLKRV